MDKENEVDKICCYLYCKHLEQNNLYKHDSGPSPGYREHGKIMVRSGAFSVAQIANPNVNINSEQSLSIPDLLQDLGIIEVEFNDVTLVDKKWRITLAEYFGYSNIFHEGYYSQIDPSLIPSKELIIEDYIKYRFDDLNKSKLIENKTNDISERVDKLDYILDVLDEYIDDEDIIVGLENETSLAGIFNNSIPLFFDFLSKQNLYELLLNNSDIKMINQQTYEYKSEDKDVYKKNINTGVKESISHSELPDNCLSCRVNIGD